MNNMPVRVLCFGTFDGLHKGHEFFLSMARSLGSELHVLVSRDETVSKVKKKKTVRPEDVRLDEISSNRNVDVAYLGSLDDKYAILSIVNPYVIALGHDQHYLTDNLSEELKNRGLEHTTIVRVPSFFREVYSSSNINSYDY